jgi:hypothetical protein
MDPFYISFLVPTHDRLSDHLYVNKPLTEAKHALESSYSNAIQQRQPVYVN